MRQTIATTFFCLTVGSCQIVVAGGFTEQFIDKDDGWLDASEFLKNNAFGFLPLPLIITEPAVGNGLGVVGLKLFPPNEGDLKPEPGQYQATAGYTNVNLDWYGGGPIPLPSGIEFNVKGYMIDQDFRFRIGKSDWFLGANWRYQK